MTTEQPRLMRAGQAMAIATAVSRATGFARTLALVTALGLGTRLLDAYTVANVTPNVIYDLVLGGALASVVVPLLVRADDDLFAQRLLSLVIYGLSAIVIAAILATPFIVDFYAPGFNPAQRHVAIVFTRYFMPQILFYGVSATLAAMLNARNRFASPMWAPVANNLVVIATALTFLLLGGDGRLESLTHGQALLLSIGTSAGVAAQVFILAIASRRAGFSLRPRVDLRGIGVRRIAVMAGWTLLSVAAAQASFTLVTRLTSQAGAGAISVYTNAYTLFQLPYAVIAVTVITGILPRMSRAAADNRLAEVISDLSQSLRLTAVMLAPVAAGLIVAGPRLTTLLFDHGNASPAASHLTGLVLAAYGLALVPFAGYQIALRVFYALGDTRTPALASAAVSVGFAAASLTAAQFFHGPDLVIALAAGNTLTYAGGFALTVHVLRRKIGRVDGHRVLNSLIRILAAASVAGLAAAVTVHALAPTGTTGSLLAIATVAVMVAGLFALGAQVLRVSELSALTATLRRTSH